MIKNAAYTQAYAFLIGTITSRMNLAKTPIDTTWYRLLLEQSQAIANDTPELFKAIQTQNRFAAPMREHFKQITQELLSELE